LIDDDAIAKNMLSIEDDDIDDGERKLCHQTIIEYPTSMSNLNANDLIYDWLILGMSSVMIQTDNSKRIESTIITEMKIRIS
jgi:hypothetical protein